MAKVAVFGASGFTGALVADLLWRHPEFNLVALYARSNEKERLVDLYPHYRVPLQLTQYSEISADLDAAIVAYPHGAAASTVVQLLKKGVKVVDLSADFRLRNLVTYEHWYTKHPAADWLQKAVYGLPELYREQIQQSQLVANPGCYPTATLLALAPLARAGLIQDIIIDAKSGVSGAGRTATTKTHFVTINENVIPYGVAQHRHIPEIEQELALLGAKLPISFVPHLLPLDQGELVSCYITPKESITNRQLGELYQEAYRNEQFVELVAQPPGVRAVRETNYCQISTHIDHAGRILVFSVIDNLWKGASAQAVQNLNLMFNLPEELGVV